MLLVPHAPGWLQLSCRQADVVKVEIAAARSEIMAPLSAASMESYTRAYPYLVKLHMLQASCAPHAAHCTPFWCYCTCCFQHHFGDSAVIAVSTILV